MKPENRRDGLLLCVFWSFLRFVELFYLVVMCSMWVIDCEVGYGLWFVVK